MEAYVWWAIIGIGLIIVEIMSGTLLLLVLGVAALAGAAAAWFGAGFWLQALIVAGLAALGMIVAGNMKKKSTASSSNASLDVGHTVILESWVSEADGIAKVRYRNAVWDARVNGGHKPGTTVFYICATDGNTLHVATERPR